MFAGTFRYGIELYDTSSAHDVLINHELILAGVGQATLKCHKVMKRHSHFSKPVQFYEIYFKLQSSF